ncbi:MAG: aspartate--tRNA ligase [Nitriliruptorales bacterium]|nr:aspartate--tRNA ligase [Nitriliruptorales bacterium]
MTPYGSLRTHGAGILRRQDDGERVTLAGWVATRRDHGGKAFFDLRDRSGVVQVVAESDEALDTVHRLRSEYVVRVTGAVRVRPEGMTNDALDTGEVEVAAGDVEILSSSLTPPFPLEDRVDADETMRLQYRYLDIRRPSVARVMRIRSQVTGVIRRVMEANGFLDIETPLLTRSTPEGARDFLVPSRLQPGSFYALPQSPQLFKQLLMVAGMERYYQIARCFRDEDLRADRQPEFTQLDVEASFITEEDIYSLHEELMATLWREVLEVELALPFPRLRFDEAMRRYGSDKPDTRFDMELVELGEVFADTEVGVFKGALHAGGSVIALCLPQGGSSTRKQFDEWVEFAKRRGARGLAWGVVESPTDPSGQEGRGSLRSPLSKFMRPEEIAGVLSATGARPGDAVFFGAGTTRPTQELMGAVRVAMAERHGLIPDSLWNFVWITDWPMFEWNDDDKRWDAMHHPFTAPATQWLDRLEDAPGEATARAYDLALNGTELGGGSIRIHQRDVQERVFTLLGIDEDEAREKFGFLLDGLSYGAPPHGGIAFGLDRLVMLMAGGQSLRDVIPFPKTQSGADPLTAAPAPVDDDQLAAVGLRTLPPSAKG